MLKKKIQNSDSNSKMLNRILDNDAISIHNISKQQKTHKEDLQPTSDTEGFTGKEVHYIKEEVLDVDESSNCEMSEYSDYENTTYVTENSANEIFFVESIDFEAAYSDDRIPPDKDNDIGQLYDLIDFTCTKCRKISKNPDYFEKKTDLQCSDCQSTMKFQCPRCKLLFRQFDSAVRHAKGSCPNQASAPPSPVSKEIIMKDVRKCSACDFKSRSLTRFRDHVRLRHPNDESAYTCSSCSKHYKSRDSMMKHMRHCGEEPHIVCVFCGYRTKRNEHLRVHMRHKHPDPESCHGGGYNCPKCQKKYKYLTSMKSHVKICGLNKVELFPQAIVESTETMETPLLVAAEADVL